MEAVFVLEVHLDREPIEDAVLGQGQCFVPVSSPGDLERAVETRCGVLQPGGVGHRLLVIVAQVELDPAHV